MAAVSRDIQDTEMMEYAENKRFEDLFVGYVILIPEKRNLFLWGISSRK